MSLIPYAMQLYLVDGVAISGIQNMSSTLNNILPKFALVSTVEWRLLRPARRMKAYRPI